MSLPHAARHRKAKCRRLRTFFKRTGALGSGRRRRQWRGSGATRAPVLHTDALHVIIDGNVVHSTPVVHPNGLIAKATSPVCNPIRSRGRRVHGRPRLSARCRPAGPPRSAACANAVCMRRAAARRSSTARSEVRAEHLSTRPCHGDARSGTARGDEDGGRSRGRPRAVEARQSALQVALHRRTIVEDKPAGADLRVRPLFETATIDRTVAEAVASKLHPRIHEPHGQRGRRGRVTHRAGHERLGNRTCYTTSISSHQGQLHR